MPDPSRKTISASQAAMLFGASPYGTPRTLYDWLHDGVDNEPDENDSMAFGKFVQEFILKRAQERLNLEVVPNLGDSYVRHATEPLGCTHDAHLRSPSFGYGPVEAKSVRYQVYKDQWIGGKAPLHIEIQLQAQMLVMGAEWGVIAVMVGANEDFDVLMRKPDYRVHERLIEEARAMMLRVETHDRPDVFGNPAELVGLESLYPNIVPTKMFEDLNDVEFGQILRDYDYARTQKQFWDKAEKEQRAKVLDRSKDHGLVRVYGAEAKVRRSHADADAAALPFIIRDRLETGLKTLPETCSKEFRDAIQEAINWRQTIRTAHSRTSISIKTIEDDPAPPDDVGSFIIQGG